MTESKQTETKSLVWRLCDWWDETIDLIYEVGAFTPEEFEAEMKDVEGIRYALNRIDWQDINRFFNHLKEGEHYNAHTQSIKE